MASTEQNVNMYAGDDLTITVTVTDADGNAVNLTGYTFRYELNTPTVVVKTLDDGITVTNAAGGIFTIALDEDDTVGVSGAFPHGCKCESSTGDTSQLFIGTVVIADGIVDAV